MEKKRKTKKEGRKGRRKGGSEGGRRKEQKEGRERKINMASIPNQKIKICKESIIIIIVVTCPLNVF